MTTLTEGMHTGEFIGEMAMGIGYHTKRVTMLTGTAYKAGAVLGKVTASGKFTTYDNAAATGIEAAAAILLESIDATGGDKTGTIVFRGPMIVNANDLGWGANNAGGITAGKDDLDLIGIKAV